MSNGFMIFLNVWKWIKEDLKKEDTDSTIVAYMALIGIYGIVLFPVFVFFDRLLRGCL